jgi:hypothetical protein
MSSALFSSRRVLWLPLEHGWHPPTEDTTFCCDEIAAGLRHDCDQHADPFSCPDTLLIYHEIFDEIGLPIRDGGPSYLVISHCPFCGSKLPESKRDEWFNRIEAEGLEDSAFENLPDHFQNDDWYRKAL